MRAAEALVLPVRASSGRALSPQAASRFPPVRIPPPIPCCSERDERSVSGFISVVRGRMSAFLNGLSSCKGIRFPFTVSGVCRKGKKRGRAFGAGILPLFACGSVVGFSPSGCARRRQSFHPSPAASCEAPAVPGGRIGLRMNILRSRTKPSGDLPDFVGRDRLRQPYREGWGIISPPEYADPTGLSFPREAPLPVLPAAPALRRS